MQESSNTRINMLFMLDVCLTDDSGTNPDGAAVYRELAVRDLPALIDTVSSTHLTLPTILLV